MSTTILALALCLSFSAITVGASLISAAAGWIVGGLLGAALSVLLFVDVPDDRGDA